MKRTLLIILLCTASLAGVRAQTSETHVSVRAGEERLECLLTESQKSSVTHLTVTGTLRDEDYAYLRGGLLARLEELNLRDADIDTIPAHAFDVDVGLGSPDKRIVLPLNLRYVSDYGLCMAGASCVYELTGEYPGLGNSVFSHYDSGTISNAFISVEPAEDNLSYSLGGNCLYSSDGSVLYRGNYNFIYIQEGTRCINEKAFENVYLDKVVIPATVDSIGERAFAGSRIPVYTGNVLSGELVCEALCPPKLGKEAFLEPYFECIYVPLESMESYRAAAGWNTFNIRAITTDGLRQYSSENTFGLAMEAKAGSYMLAGKKEMVSMDLYTINGQRVCSIPVGCCCVELSKGNLVYPYTLVRVSYKDGTADIVKVRP